MKLLGRFSRILVGNNKKFNGDLAVHKKFFSLTKRLQHAPNYYSVLGLGKYANQNEIKRAYFEKAKLYHPDNSMMQSDENRQMFQMIAEAYEVLADEKKRKLYDETGTVATARGGRTESGPQRPREDVTDDPEELFQRIFMENEHERARRTAEEAKEYAESYSGTDKTQEANITIGFTDAALGLEIEFPLRLIVTCPKCLGDKSELGYTWQVCVYCEGTGVQTEKHGHVTTRKPCSYCHGTKQFHRFKCLECEGTGKTVLDYAQKVHIPPGVMDGQVLKIQIDEKPLRAAHYQDPFFYIYIKVEDHDELSRDYESMDVRSNADISPAQAVLGGNLITKGLYSEPIKVPVPTGTCSHRSIIARDMGIPYPAESGLDMRGHHFVEVGIEVPAELFPYQTELWRDFALIELQNEKANFNGTVNGLETKISHKFEDRVVEASKIERNFNPVKKLVDVSESDADKMAAQATPILENLRDALRSMGIGGSARNM